ncbi:response regulator [Compostimonas suwonensis]|uniref:DNA-binding NarL/FixJ family response regulator n=1 Tax=Compostimonas suwonensis TaxID=1048394 RepID=A0A2M9C062_9MICO|nr:response regulator transcription factor [Compostimonas suwonensis]PJJ63726.1 DNA-binding NarL/FixJ family response regulator [Compostimonas suwonensis]
MTATTPASFAAPAIRVAIADDQTLFCSGIRMLVESQDDLAFAGVAYDGEQIVELALREQPDVILMDIRMPKADGVTATERILAAGLAKPPNIIVLTTYQRDVAVLSAITAGASGFIMKDATPEFLLASIRAVHAGQSVIAPSSTVGLIRDLAPQRELPPADTSIEVLSAREKEVFLFAARGLSNAEIAATAFISETTVKSHISSILGKLGMHSRVQLVAHAYENGLIR